MTTEITDFPQNPKAVEPQIPQHVTAEENARRYLALEDTVYDAARMANIILTVLDDFDKSDCFTQTHAWAIRHLSEMVHDIYCQYNGRELPV